MKELGPVGVYPQRPVAERTRKRLGFEFLDKGSKARKSTAVGY